MNFFLRNCKGREFDIQNYSQIISKIWQAFILNNITLFRIFINESKWRRLTYPTCYPSSWPLHVNVTNYIKNDSIKVHDLQKNHKNRIHTKYAYWYLVLINFKISNRIGLKFWWKMDSKFPSNPVTCTSRYGLQNLSFW